MKALVLSAGYGERLRPLTNTIPKPLLEVGGRPLIEYALLTLKAAGITEIAINVHHLARQIENALGDGHTRGLTITYSRETVLMGSGGPLLALHDFFANDAFVILNSDTIMELELRDVIARHRAHGGLATLVLRAGHDADAYSRIEIDASRRIRRIRLLRSSRAPGEFDDYSSAAGETVATAPQPYMYCGVMVCAPEMLTGMPSAPPFGLVRDLVAPRLTQGAALLGYVHEGFFRTVDDLPSYNALHAEFAAAAPPLACLRAGQT